jgi:hypothetical protein
MTLEKLIESSRRAYAFLLRFYPDAYRREYSGPMLQLFTDQCRTAVRERGSAGLAVFWARTMADFAASAAREHVAAPGAGRGLLDAAPDRPLPWKGVAIVLIPCLIFFFGQLSQLAGEDTFFLLIARAAFFLIVPVGAVWMWKRTFPVWGLVPLGLFFRAVLELVPRVQFLLGKIDYYLALWTGKADWSQLASLYKTYRTESEILSAAFLAGTSVFLILRIARSQRVPRGAWMGGGALLLLLMLDAGAGIFSYAGTLARMGPEFLLGDSIPSILRGIGSAAYANFTRDAGFVLLLLVGAGFARRNGPLALLLPLGYLIPVVVLGRFDGTTAGPALLAGISLAVFAYRAMVTLIGPVWIARAAFTGNRGIGGGAALPISAGILLLAHGGYCIALGSAVGWSMTPLEALLYIAPDLILLAGMVLAAALYSSAAPPTSPETPAAERDAGAHFAESRPSAVRRRLVEFVAAAGIAAAGWGLVTGWESAARMPSGGREVYLVQAGDSCNSIASGRNVEIEALIRDNRLSPDCELYAGELLFLRQ